MCRISSVPEEYAPEGCHKPLVAGIGLKMAKKDKKEMEREGRVSHPAGGPPEGHG